MDETQQATTALKLVLSHAVQQHGETPAYALFRQTGDPQTHAASHQDGRILLQHLASMRLDWIAFGAEAWLYNMDGAHEAIAICWASPTGDGGWVRPFNRTDDGTLQWGTPLDATQDNLGTMLEQIQACLHRAEAH